ncbi:MAG TPA: LysE family transporter, partial [Novosphingobium sp.]|nr:LysE family transporter [Novosphingobium sp.]
MTLLFPPFLAGFALCAALIVAIGAQNLFVLRQGLLRAHVGPIVLFCIAADVALIGAGVGGVAAALRALPQLTLGLTLGGAAFLAWY